MAQRGKQQCSRPVITALILNRRAAQTNSVIDRTRRSRSEPASEQTETGVTGRMASRKTALHAGAALCPWLGQWYTSAMPRKKRTHPKKLVRAAKAAKVKKAALAARKAALARRGAQARKTASAKKAGLRKRRLASRAESAGPVPVLEADAIARDERGFSRLRGDAESVNELAEEGQAMEAELLSGVEAADAANADESEVTTREVPEDDVPPEYRDTD